MYSWGCNDDGALGRSGEENVPLPIPTFENVPIRAVKVGDCHSAFLDFANRLWLCGTYKDSSGHLGFPDYEKGIGHTHHKSVEPVLVSALPPRMRVEEFACGANHTVVVLSDSRKRSSLANAPSMGFRVMSWGNDEFGQLGLGAREDEEGRPEEDTVMLKHTRRGKRHQKVKLFPRDVVWQSKTGGGIKRVFASAQTSFVQTMDGSVFGCGLNNFGQVGFGTTSPYPVRTLTRVDPLSHIHVEFISGGTVHAAARTKDGHVHTWGRRDYSGLPLPEKGRESDVQVPSKVPGINAQVTFLACGGSHTLASTSSGKVFAWGFGGTHQLGNLPRDISQGAASADDEATDEQTPYCIQSKQLQDRFVVAVGAGAQHSVELAWTGEYSSQDLSAHLSAMSTTPTKRKSGSNASSAKKRLRVKSDE